MPIRIEQMEIPFAPGSILRLFRLESQLVKASPERVRIRDMEDEPTPAVDPLTLLQIENRRVCIPRLTRREGRLRRRPAPASRAIYPPRGWRSSELRRISGRQSAGDGSPVA